MTDAIAEMKEAFKESFMKPKCYRGHDIEEVIIESGLDFESEGFYCRLSADGYMDCTDWHGPFDSISACARHLVETYADC
jgi:hypothetical protein